MIIRRAEFRNYCQHRNLELEFSPHLNLIVGPNGAGKSNVLNGLLYLLTGADRNEGRLTDNIMWGRPRGQQTAVSGVLEHGNVSCDVYREISGRSPTHQIRIGHDNPVVGVTQTNDAILELLQTSKQRIEDYVFVKQRGIDAWLDKQPRDRINELGQLFGVERCEKIWTALGTFMTRVQVPSLAADIDEIRQGIAAAEAEVTEKEQELAPYGDVPEDVQQQLEQLQATIDGFLVYTEAANQLEQTESSLQLANEEFRQADEAVRQAKQDVDLIHGAVDEDRLRYEPALVQLQAWTSYEAGAGMRQGLTHDIAVLADNWRTRQDRPVKPSFYDTVQEAAWQQRYAELDERRVDNDSAIRQLRGLNPGDPCPTCGAPAASVAERLQGLEMQRQQIAPLFQPMVEQLQACQQYDSQLLAWRTHRDQLHERAINLKAQLARVQAIPEPDEPKESLEAITREHQQLVQDLQTARAVLAANERTLNDRQTRKQTAEQANLQARHRLQQLAVVTQDQRDQAVTQRNTLQQRATMKATLVGMLNAARMKVQHQQERLAEHQRLQQRRTRIQNALGRLEAVRTIHHRTEAPRMVTFTYLEQMTVEINETLMLFDAPYYVVPTDDLGFLATFYDGKEQSDKRLSAGQRIVLAMAFRITVNSTFAGSLGMLSMDEPTAGLDEHNLGCLPRALDKLRELSQARGLQIFFVTHEPRIAHHFDNVIEIE